MAQNTNPQKNQPANPQTPANKPAVPAGAPQTGSAPAAVVTAEAATTTAPAATVEGEKTNKSIINPKYRGKYKEPDFLGKTINEAATKMKTVTTKGAEGQPDTTKKVADGVDVVALFELAKANGIDVEKFRAQQDGHGFPGRFRMTVRNMLQATTKARHGLYVMRDGHKVWVPADTEWLHANSAPATATHDREGAKVKAAASTEAKPGVVQPAQ